MDTFFLCNSNQKLIRQKDSSMKELRENKIFYKEIFLVTEKTEMQAITRKKICKAYIYFLQPIKFWQNGFGKIFHMQSYLIIQKHKSTFFNA